MRAVDQGRPRGEIVKTFGMSEASHKRSLKQGWDTAEEIPKSRTRCPAKTGDALEAGLGTQLQAHRDATLQE